MNQYFKQNAMRLFVAFALVTCAMFGIVDPASAAIGGALLLGEIGEVKELEAAVKNALAAMQGGLKAMQDKVDSAIEEVRKEGTLHGETNVKLTELSTNAQKLQSDFKAANDRLQALEQARDKKTQQDEQHEKERKSAGQLVVESEQFKAMTAGGSRESRHIELPRKSLLEMKGVLNATLDMSQPLVEPFRVPGIITPPTRRLTIRDLMPQLPVSSNLVAFASENVFTNSANVQGAGSSPAETEGQPKAESNITFTLNQEAVVTVAHWIAASRQVLEDATQLRAYIDSRMGYGLKLKEETEFLSGSGGAGQINGLLTQATAYNRGASNDTKIDCLLKALLQVSLSEYEASGFVLNPVDWVTILLLKDTQGRYLFADPHNMEASRIWGKPVVATQSMSLGSFLAGAFDIGAAVYDRETMTIRISEAHQDFFVRNLIAILCEERCALVVYRTAAFVTGTLPAAGS